MKKVISSFLLCFALLEVHGQVNLVPNPSFEEYSNCPTGPGQIFFAQGWLTFRESPDYFNSCVSIASYFSVPNNGSGYQQAASGNAYAGIICYNNSIMSREIIANILTDSLSIGQKYFISFKVSKADDSATAAYSINKLGVKFSTVTQTNASIDNIAMVYTNNVVLDNVNWTTVSGSFIADSAYQYLMIGNFFDDANTTVINNGSGFRAYYYIDDVCLSTDSLFCDNVSVEENNLEHQFTFYSNPENQFVTVQNNLNVPFRLTVFNALGQKLYNEQSFSSNNLQLDVSSYHTGLLFLKITSQNNQFTYKILKY